MAKTDLPVQAPDTVHRAPTTVVAHTPVRTATEWTVDPNGQRMGILEVRDLHTEWVHLPVVAYATVDPYRHAAWSKNRTWRHDRGRTHLDPAAVKARDALAVLLLEAMGRTRLRRNRAWVWFHIWLADHRGDAHNATALVLDAVKVATNLDDRWLCLGPVTWSIDHDRPRMAVWVGQADLPDLPAPKARSRVKRSRPTRDSLGTLRP